jgi:hypothetical protein
VFYYSVELFCLILLDYSVWKMYQTNFFHFFRNGIFFLSSCAISLELNININACYCMIQSNISKLKFFFEIYSDFSQQNFIFGKFDCIMQYFVINNLQHDNSDLNRKIEQE